MGSWLARWVDRRPRTAVVGILGIFALVAGVILVAPAVVSLAIGGFTAGAWCWGLEKSAALARPRAPHDGLRP